jgi:hypothetical protein
VFHARQPLIQSLEGIGQPFVINAQLMQNRGIYIVNVDRSLKDIVTKIVRLPEHRTSADSTATKPERVTTTMMIASVIFGSQLPLAVNGTAKLSAPDNQCFIEHSPLLEILDEGGCGLIRIFTLTGNSLGKPAVLIPSSVIQLNKPYTALS